MSEKENEDVHRIERGPIHPAVAMASHMARQLHAARAGSITADEFAEHFHSVSANSAWREHGITMGTAALMVAAALQLQSVIGQTAALSTTVSPASPVASEANAHAQRNMETVSALSALAEQFGRSSQA